MTARMLAAAAILLTLQAGSASWAFDSARDHDALARCHAELLTASRMTAADGPDLMMRPEAEGRRLGSFRSLTRSQPLIEAARTRHGDDWLYRVAEHGRSAEEALRRVRGPARVRAYAALQQRARRCGLRIDRWLVSPGG